VRRLVVVMQQQALLSPKFFHFSIFF
jgi:hypothetical protein